MTVENPSSCHGAGCPGEAVYSMFLMYPKVLRDAVGEEPCRDIKPIGETFCTWAELFHIPSDLLSPLSEVPGDMPWPFHIMAFTEGRQRDRP